MGVNLTHPSAGERIDQSITTQDFTGSSLLAPDTPGWEKVANCLQINTGLFSVEGCDEIGADPDDAREVCRSCIAKAACLGFAIEHSIGTSIWGGLDPNERQLYAQQV